MIKKLRNKRFMAVMLVALMVVSMSFTAFAGSITPVTPTYPMTITVQFEASAGTITDSNNVSHIIPAINVNKDVDFDSSFTTQFPIETGANHELDGYPTVMDAIWDAYKQYDPTMSGLVMGWDTYSTPNGAYLTDIFGIGTITQAATSNSWEGYSWSISLDGAPISLYASNVQVEDDNEILVEFVHSIETW